MGLVSMLPRIAGYGKRILKAAPEMMLGTGSDVIGAAARSTKGSVLTKARAGFRALEGDIAAKQISQGGFFKRLLFNLKDTPKAIGRSTKAGFGAAKAAGKSGIWGGIKGFGKGIGKKMPFIGAAMTVLFELPNIWTATKEQGIGQGVKETAKAGARLAGGAVGAAIGSAICPGIGSIIGWVAGEWLTSKVVGKSYSEQKMDAEEEIAQAQAQQQQAGTATTFTGNPYDIPPSTGMTNPMGYNNNGYNNFGYNDYSNPYADDIMMQNLNFNMMA